MELQDEALFIRGFNSAYILAEHEPDLLAKVLHNITPSTDYVVGLSSGQRQYQLEREARAMDQLGQLRQKGSDREPGLER